MLELTPELRERFLRFRDAYEHTKAKLEADDASGYVIAGGTWEAALKEVPLTPDELKLYRKLVAMHSVNGGELFGIDDR